MWIIGSISLKLTGRLVARAEEKRTWALESLRPICRFKLNPVKCHQSFLNKERATCSGEFSGSGLQSKRGGSSVVSGKGSIFFLLPWLIWLA